MKTGLSLTADVNDGYRYWATFDDHPFAEGSCRYAYKGTLHGYGPRNGEICVTKVFKNEFAMQTRNWIPDVAASMTAKGYADEFIRANDAILSNYIGKSTIEFVVPLVALMEEITVKNVIRVGEAVIIEPFIPGSYVKFNSNGGYENGAYQLMTTFCHWTYYKSRGFHMVCDLQGVKSGNRYILTDPVIHSRYQQFGATDLGEEGMKMVLANHRCNVLCQSMGLYNPYAGFAVPAGPPCTLFIFQVKELNLTTFRPYAGNLYLTF